MRERPQGGEAVPRPASTATTSGATGTRGIKGMCLVGNDNGPLLHVITGEANETHYPVPEHLSHCVVRIIGDPEPTDWDFCPWTEVARVA